MGELTVSETIEILLPIAKSMDNAICEGDSEGIISRGAMIEHMLSTVHYNMMMLVNKHINDIKKRYTEKEDE